jgi:hypothetical protein
VVKVQTTLVASPRNQSSFQDSFGVAGVCYSFERHRIYAAHTAIPERVAHSCQLGIDYLMQSLSVLIQFIQPRIGLINFD